MKKIFLAVLLFMMGSTVYAKTITVTGSVPQNSHLTITRWDRPRYATARTSPVEVSYNPISKRFEYKIDLEYGFLKPPRIRNLRALLVEYHYNDRIGAFFIKNTPGTLPDEQSLDLTQPPNAAGYVTKMLEMDLHCTDRAYVLNFKD